MALCKGGKAVGPLDSKEMRVILSKISDPRICRSGKLGSKAGNAREMSPELAEFIHEPPPLPHEPSPLSQITHLAPLCRGTKIVKPSELAAEL